MSRCCGYSPPVFASNTYHTFNRCVICSRNNWSETAVGWLRRRRGGNFWDEDKKRLEYLAHAEDWMNKRGYTCNWNALVCLAPVVESMKNVLFVLPAG